MATNGDKNKNKKKNMHKRKASLPVPGIRKGRTLEDSTSGQSAGPKRTVRENVPSLRERETDLIGILNATQESILLFSADGTLRMANRIALERFGKPAEIVIGKHVNDLVPPKLAKARLARLQEVVRTGTPVEFEDMRAGILFRHTFSPVFDTTGNVTDVAIFSRDITGERKNEERLSYLASFPQLNPNPVLEADLTGAVTFANPATYRTLEHLGLDITNTKAFVPSDLSNVVAAWDKKRPATVDREVRIADRVFTTSAYLDPGLGVARIYAYDITERKQTEESLRRSEAQFRTLADSIPNLAWWANGDGYITWYNRRWYEYTGTTPEQMEGWGWKSVHDPKVLPEVLERWKASISTAEPFEMEFPLRGADGVFRTFLTRVLPLKDPAGRALRWFGTNTDVSALKLAKDAMRESERRERERAEELATMLEVVPTPVVIVHDPDSTHMTGNRAADELLRQPRGAEASLSAPPEVKPRHFKAIKDGRELKLDELPAQRAARGEVVRDFEFNLVFDDGTTRSLLGYGTPLLDEQGRPRGAVHVLVDITARKLAEEELRLSREDLNRAQEVAHVGSWRLDVRRNVLIWSDENHRIFGIPKGTPLTYETFLGTVHPDDRELVDTQWKEALRDQPYDIEHRLLVDGQVRWVREKAYLELDNDSALIGGFGITQDITARKRAEDILREYELKASALINAADESIWLFGLQGEILAANNTAAGRLGMNVNEVIGKNWQDLIPSGVAAARKAKVDEVVRTNNPVRFEDERAGMIFDHTAYPVRDTSGRITAVAFFSRDITALKRAEQEREQLLAKLKQNTAELDTIFKALPYLVSVHGPDGRYLRVNPAIVELFGFDPISSPREETARRVKAHFPDGRPLTAENMPSSRALKGEAVSGVEYLIHDGQGNEHVLLMSAIPLKINDNVYGAVLAQMDITERKRMEEALRYSEEQYRKIVETANEGIWVVDCDRKTTYVNEKMAMILGYDAQEMIGMAGREFLDEEGRSLSDINIAKRQQGISESYELKLFRKDTTPIWVLVNATPLFDRDGKFSGTLSMITDITERKQAEESIRRNVQELAERNKELTRFNQAAVDRELRMIELKREINKACAESGKPPRYRVDFDKDQDTSLR